MHISTFPCTTSAPIREVDKFGDGTVTICGANSIKEKTYFVMIPMRLTTQRYIDLILEDQIMITVLVNFYDNARPHTAAYHVVQPVNS